MTKRELPEAVKQAAAEYALTLKTRSDMDDEAREEAERHYVEGLMKFHKPTIE